MTTPIKPASVLADVGELPRPTDTINTAATGPTTAAGTDSKGVAFDASIHERRLRADGQWCRKRGNGARKLAGKAFHLPGRTGTGSPAVAPPVGSNEPPASDPPPATAQPSFAAGSVAGHLDQGETSPIGSADNPEMIPPGALTEADYAATGETLTRGAFGIAQLALDGKAWEPRPAESKAFASCFARIWHHYKWPRLGPLFELFFLVPPAVASRADEPRTKRLLTGLKRVLARLFGRTYLEEHTQPDAAQPPAQPAPPAQSAPAPVVDHADRMGKFGKR